MNNLPAPPLPILDTDDAVQTHVSTLLGTAIQLQLWFMALDADNRTLPFVVPLGGIPPRPDGNRDVQQLALIMDRFCSQVSALDAQLIVAIERPGPILPTEADRAWARAIHVAASVSNAQVRAVLLCHSNGVRLLAPSAGT